MELIATLDQRRLRRELRRREAALREAARAASPTGRRPAGAPAEAPPTTEAPPEWLVTPSTPSPRNWCECDFCGRGFHGYGQFLNHNCHADD